MPPKEPEHYCELFSRPEEKDSLREFTHWLANGGMDSLRDMQQTANDYKRVRDIGFGMICKAVWGAVLLALGLGGMALIKRYGE